MQKETLLYGSLVVFLLFLGNVLVDAESAHEPMPAPTIAHNVGGNNKENSNKKVQNEHTSKTKHTHKHNLN